MIAHAEKSLYFDKSVDKVFIRGFLFLIIEWLGGAMVLGKLLVPGRPTICITVGQGPTALAVGAGGGGLDIFTLICPFSPLSPSLWETVRYRQIYCLKGPLNPKQPTKPFPIYGVPLHKAFHYQPVIVLM